MTELNSEVRKYLGKDLKGQGQKKDKEGKDLTWKLFQLRFENVDSQYPKTFTSFDTISPKGVQVKDMEEGNYYKVLYKNEEYENEYGKQQSRKVVMITLSSEDEYKRSKSSIPMPGNSSKDTAKPQQYQAQGDEYWQRRAEQQKQREEEIKVGQAINLSVQLLSSSPQFKLSEFDSTLVEQLTLNTTLPMITRIQEKVKQLKLDQSNKIEELAIKVTTEPKQK